jgi:hypothetical protein
MSLFVMTPPFFSIMLQGVDEETGKFMFSLEANNLVDEDGNSKQTSMPYFEEGWLPDEDEEGSTTGFKFPWQK